MTPDLAALGEKHVRTDEAVEIDLLAERAGLVVVLEDPAKPKHDHLFELESGLNFIGSYCARSLAAVSRKRRICGSVWVAQRAMKYSNKNISNPPSKLLSRLNVAAPRHMAKKKSFRSAPRIVSGRDSDRCTLLIRLASAMCFSVANVCDSVAGKKPRQEVHRRDGHANAEEHAGKHALRAAFAESEGETGDNDGNEREAAGDGAGESLSAAR